MPGAGVELSETDRKKLASWTAEEIANAFDYCGALEREAALAWLRDNGRGNDADRLDRLHENRPGA